MVIDYGEVVEILEDVAKEVAPVESADVYLTLAFVAELHSKYNVLLKDYGHLVNAFEAGTQREAKVIENYKMVVAGKDGKYAALHDYCAVVEAERNELRQRNGVQSNSIGILQNKVAELEVQADTLAKGFMKLFAEKLLSL